MANVRFAARTLDSRRYSETFSAFASRSSEYTAMIDRLVEFASTLPPNFSCLDVGAGTGSVLRDWKRQSQDTVPGHYVAIEPNLGHIPMLRETMADLDIDGTLIEEPFDPRTNPTEEKFDLILFSHALYWIPNPIQCVQRVVSWLKSGGILLIFHQGPFGFYTLFSLFDPLLERDTPIMPDHGLSSHELVNGLRECNLSPCVMMDAAHIDLTDLSEQERDEVLSFILQIEFRELEEPLKGDIAQYLGASCVKTATGRLLLHHPNVTIVVRR